jgi:hypothetical protein
MSMPLSCDCHVTVQIPVPVYPVPVPDHHNGVHPEVPPGAEGCQACHGSGSCYPCSFSFLLLAVG